MAPYAPNSAAGGGGGYSKWASSFHQADIEKGTELFRKQLGDNVHKSQVSQPSVKGGLPPHLLRQKSQNDRPVHGDGYSQDMATPPGANTSHSYAGPHQTQKHSATNFPQIYSAHDSWVTSPRRQVPHQDLGTQSSLPYPPRRDIDSRTRDARYSGLPASRWAGGPQQVLPRSNNQQSQLKMEHGASPLAGGVRLSINSNDDWSAFHCNENQQQERAQIPKVEEPKTRKWRPKHSCDLESQDLPDSVASSINFDDSDSSLDEDAAPVSRDIRNAVGGEVDLVRKVHGDGFYNKHQWDEYPDQTKSLEWRPTYCQLWVNELENEQWPVANFLHVKDIPHEECDVQTRNGWLMPPVDFPDTHINPQDAQVPQNSGASSRRLLSTADLNVKAQYSKLKRRVDEREREVMWFPIEDPFPNFASPQQPAERSGQPTPPATYSYVNRSPVMDPEPLIHRPERIVQHAVYGTIKHLPRTITSRPPPTYLKIACFLRPAEEEDIPQILGIYNWEVSHGMQALDTKPLCLEDMQHVFKQCRDAETPIIVAVAGTPAEAKARRDDTPVPRDQHGGPQRQAQQAEKDKVIGFAYVSIMATGLAGDVHYNVDRFSGRVHIYVAHECRRKGIGRALLQRVTMFCSRHAGHYAGEYKWHDPEQMPTYDEAAYNSRNYSRISVEFASRGKNDPDTLWMSKFLDTENFKYVSTQNKSRNVGHGENGELFDTIVWQHDCQDLDRAKENIRNLR